VTRTRTREPRIAIGRAHGWGRLAALLAAVLLAGLTVGTAAAASETLVPACDGVNIRTAASTTAPIKVRLSLASTVTVSGTVAGSAWSTSCPAWKSGSTWYTVTHVNGTPVGTLYGVAVVYAASGVLAVAAASTPDPGPATPPAEPTAAPASTTATAPPAAGSQTLVPGCDGVNIRASASTGAPIKARLGVATLVTVSGTVSGSAWGTSCPSWKSGSSWYAVTHVNGTPVATLFGATVLYAATGVLKAPAAAGAAPAPAATPAPSTASPATPAPTEPPVGPAPVSPAPTPSSGPATTVLAPACDGVNLRTSTSTSAAIKVRLGAGSSVTVDGTVGGSSWRVTCPTSKSGSAWYRVTHVNGVAVASRYGIAALYAATGVLASAAPVTPVTPVAPPAPVTPGSSAGPAASPPPGSSGLTALGASVTLYGRGNGHGVGLSQYGARGRALAGQTAAQILAAYYAGTTIGSIAVDARIRVLLLDNFAPSATKPLTIYGRGGPWTVTGVAGELPADARLRLFPSSAGVPSGRLLVESKEGLVLFDGPAVPDLRVAGTTPATTIQLFSKPTAYDLFRGTLRVLRSGATVDVINELPLEAYLRGVVPAEMPSTWPLEARIAQTIAARSYAAYGLHPATGTFDAYDDTRSQVYGGVRREQAAADSVIAATAGQVLRRGSAIVNALFHSTAGGATESNENAFVSSTGAKLASPVAYLRGAPDRDPAGIAFDASAPYATWQSKVYPISALSGIFAKDPRTAVGTLSALDLRRRGVSGRLISVTLVGSGGTKTVSGAVFVAVFNAGKPAADAALRSTLLDVVPIP
jgi:SpoIID/LytB domain protein